MKKPLFYTFGAAFTAALLLAGCTSSQPSAQEIVTPGGFATHKAPVSEDEKTGHLRFKRPDKVEYEEIPSVGCQLEPMGDLNATAGGECQLPLMLTNGSRRNIIIKEWYMFDQYNFTVFYRRLPADRPVDNRTPFKKYAVHIPLRPLPQHSELRLAPGEKASLTVNLPFIGELNPGESAAFEVYVATSLNTFKLKSHVFVITAR